MDFLMRFLKKYFPVYLLVVSLFVGSATIMTRTVTAIAEALPIRPPAQGSRRASSIWRFPCVSGTYCIFWATGPK